MHIPDGFLDLKTALATGVLSAGGLGLSLRHARLNLPARKVPLLGLSAAFVFAAQMLNFPVAAGTSGHLMGGVLTAALLGPSAAVIVISAVVIVQCFLFADGGITTLGGNIFNMALVGCVGGWAIYRVLSGIVRGLFGRVLAATLAAWISTILASIACAGELAASHTIGWSAALPAMAGVHMLIGVGEAVITAMVLAAIAKVRPDLLGLDTSPALVTEREATGTVLALGLLVSLGLVLFVAPFACHWPDGLEKTAQILGFSHQHAQQHLVSAPVSDYKLPGIGSVGLATALAGATGTIVMFGFAWLLARALVPRKAVKSADGPA